jgi:hypothetical protein
VWKAGKDLETAGDVKDDERRFKHSGRSDEKRGRLENVTSIPIIL